jgi:HSP20 family molecular chaperone IbpA
MSATHLVHRPVPSHRMHLPLFDIRESPTHYFLTLNLGGNLGSEIEIELTEVELLISSRGRFLPPGGIPKVALRVHSEFIDLSAHYRDGFLMIAMPKALHEESHQAPLGTDTMKVAP